MTQRIAILSGMDWADAQVEHVNLPDNVNIKDLEKEYKAYKEEHSKLARSWYERYPNWRRNRPDELYPTLLHFKEWLIKSGNAEESDVIEYWEY